MFIINYIRNQERMYEHLLILISIAVALGMPVFFTPVIILFFLFWIFGLHGYRNIKQVFCHPVGLSLVLYFIMNLIGLIYSTNTASGLKVIETNLNFIILPLLLFSSPSLSKSQIKKCVTAFFITILIILSLSIVVHFVAYLSSGELVIQVGKNRLNRFSYHALTMYINSWHPVYVANFLVFGCIGLVWFNKSNRLNKRTIIVLLVLTGYIITLLVLLRSLTSIIVLLCLFGLVTLKTASIKRFIALSIIALAAIIISVHFNPSFNEKFSKVVFGDLVPTDVKYERNSLTLRLAKWQSSWELIKQNPFFGVGTGGYQNEITKIYQQLGYNYLYKRQMNAHNQFLQIAGTFGFVGFIILISVYFSPLIRLEKLSFIHVLFVLTIVLFSMSEVILGRFQGVIFFVFFQVILSHQKKNESNNRGVFL